MFARATKRTVFDNGLVLLTEELPSLNSVALGIGFRLGSRQELPALGGATHLCEHLLIRALNQHLAAFGMGEFKLEGFTEREETYVSLRTLCPKLEKLLALLLDFVDGFTPSEKDFDTERLVVLEEVVADEQSEISKIDRMFFGAIYPGHALGNAIVGDSSSIKEFSFETVLEHLAKLKSARPIIAVSGNINSQRIQDLVASSTLAQRALLPAPENKIVSFAAGTTPVASDLNATYFRYAFPLNGRSHPGRVGIYALSALLGDGMSSLLFKKLREELGLVYSIKTDFSLFTDTGFFEAKGLTYSSNIGDLIPVIDETIGRSCGWNVQMSDLERIKRTLATNLLINLDDVNNRLIRLLKHEMWFSQSYSVLDDLDFVKALTLEDIRNTAHNTFSEEPQLCYGV